MPLQRPVASVSSSSAETKAGGGGTNIPMIIFAVLFLLAAGGFVWSYINYSNAKKQLVVLTDPKAQQEAAKKEVQALVDKVKKLVVLPENEDPTIATITDAPALAKEQPFYKDAHNGDKLMVYMQAKKAFIYDPNRNILVNVGPIYMENSAQQVQNALNIEVRNGSSKTGQGTTVADDLKQTAAFNVVKVANAAKGDYQGNIIVDKSKGDKNTIIDALKTKYSAAVVKDLPQGEKDTDAEVLLIVGN